MGHFYNVLFLTENISYIGSLKDHLGKPFRLIPGNSSESIRFTMEEFSIDAAIVDPVFVNTLSRDLLYDLAQSSPNAPVLLIENETRLIDGAFLESTMTKVPLASGELDYQLIEDLLRKELHIDDDYAVKTETVDELRQVIREMNFLQEVSRKISETKPLPELMQEIMESSKQVMRAEASSLLLLDKQDNKLYFHTVSDGDEKELIKQFSVDVGQGIAGWVALHKKSQLVKDCYADSRFSPEYDKKTHFVTKNMICVPLIRKGDLIGVMQVINKTGDDVFNLHDLAMFEMLAAQCAIAIENARLVDRQIENEALMREMRTARDIQQNLLPSKLPEFDDLEVTAHLNPAKEVGGDYYNIIRVNERQTLFCIADVCGKSISAALLVSTLASCITTYVKINPARFDLMEMVSGLNKVLITSTTAGKFVTGWFGLYDHETKEITSINAGHNRPCLFRSGSRNPEELIEGGIFLGQFDMPYEQEIQTLTTGDTLVFFTDGITEAMNQDYKEYGDERLIRTIQTNLERDTRTILDAIFSDVRYHTGNMQQSDDITCGILRIS